MLIRYPPHSKSQWKNLSSFSSNQQTLVLKRRFQYLSSHSCHFVKNYFFLNHTPSCICSMCLHQGGQSRDTQLVISHFCACFRLDWRYVKRFFVGFSIDFRKDTGCRVPRLYSESFCRWPILTLTCSSCEHPRKVCPTDLVGITFFVNICPDDS